MIDIVCNQQNGSSATLPQPTSEFMRVLYIHLSLFIEGWWLNYLLTYSLYGTISMMLLSSRSI